VKLLQIEKAQNKFDLSQNQIFFNKKGQNALLNKELSRFSLSLKDL